MQMLLRSKEVDLQYETKIDRAIKNMPSLIVLWKDTIKDKIATSSESHISGIAKIHFQHHLIRSIDRHITRSHGQIIRGTDR